MASEFAALGSGALVQPLGLPSSVLGFLRVAASASADTLMLNSERLLFVLVALGKEHIGKKSYRYPFDTYFSYCAAVARRARYSSSVSSGMFMRSSRSDQNRSAAEFAIARAHDDIVVVGIQERSTWPHDGGSHGLSASWGRDGHSSSIKRARSSHGHPLPICA